MVQPCTLISCLIKPFYLIHNALIVPENYSEDHHSKEHSKCEEESLHVAPRVEVSEPNCGQSGEGKVDKTKRLDTVWRWINGIGGEEIINLLTFAIIELMPIVIVALDLHDESEEHRKEKAGASKDDENLDQIQ